MLGNWNIKSMSWFGWESSRMFVSSVYKVDSLLFVLTGLWWNILFQDKPICDSTFTIPIFTISTARDNLVGWHSCNNSRVWLHDKSRWLDTWCDMILTDIPIQVASWHQNVCRVAAVSRRAQIQPLPSTDPSSNTRLSISNKNKL